MVGAKEIAVYLKKYIEQYRLEYQRFVATPPAGGGYPAIKISPYLYSKEITCYVSVDGAAIADYSQQPAYDWYIVGGPAIVVDLPETKTPVEVVKEIEKRDLTGKNIGLYRIVGKHISNDVWNGDMGVPVETCEENYLNTKIIVKFYNIKFTKLVQYLTFGALCNILDIKLPHKESSFWVPHIIRGLGFLTADRNNKTFYNYLELSPHVEEIAWDTRNITIRIQSDIRRDFGSSQEGVISIGEKAPVERVIPTNPYDRLVKLKNTIDEFEMLLNKERSGDEDIFHDFLKSNPILLDVYGTIESKPRFNYPDKESSTLKKKYIEPDFIIKLPAHMYKIVEIEKPSKYIATKQGQTRKEFTQATFQISEFKTYIRNHYDLLKDRYPEISTNHSLMLIIARTSDGVFGLGRDKNKYMQLAKGQSSADEIYTYDDLLERAKQAYTQLTCLE
jgi:hypothetical protein